MRKIILLFLIFCLLPPNAYAADLYVSVNGSSENSGSFDKPLDTIARAVGKAVANDNIKVLAGEYQERVSLSKSNLNIQALGEVKTRGFSISGSNNIIQGFRIENPQSDNGILVTGSNNLIKDNDISNTKQDGIWFYGKNNTFQNNKIHDILPPNISSDPHSDCFQTWGWNWDTTGILFEDNICEHTRTSGSNQIVMLERQTESEVRDITFRNNLFIMYDEGYSPMNFHRKEEQLEISNINVIGNTIVNVTGKGQNAIHMTNITNGLIKDNKIYGYQSLASIVGGTVEKYGNQIYPISAYNQQTPSPQPTSPPKEVPVSVRLYLQGISGDEYPFQVAIKVYKQPNNQLIKEISSNLTLIGDGIFETDTFYIYEGNYDLLVKDPYRLARKLVNASVSGNTTFLVNSKFLCGDFNSDNALDINDISDFLVIFKKLSNPVNDDNRQFDINNDRVVDVVDIAYVLSNYVQLKVHGDSVL